MFEKFQSANVESFRQRYEGTYGFYRDNTNKIRKLCRLDAIGNSRVDFVDKEGITYNIRVDAKHDAGFEFLPPKSQWYNTKDGAVWVQRVAARQFSRGITHRNVNASLLQKGLLRPMTVDFTILSEIFETPISASEAIKEFDQKSVAISGQFALDSASGRVLVMNEIIGDFKKDGKKFTFKLNEPSLWKTEITDALNALGYSSEIN
jgi:hypothetical protein